MTELNASQQDLLKSHLETQTKALAESVNQCFDLSCQVSVGADGAWAERAPEAAVRGVACLFQIDDVAAGILIPESLALPAWYRSPNDSQKARMDTLAMEWGLNLFPEDFFAERTASMALDDLEAFIDQCEPSEDARIQRLPISGADASSLGELKLIWPLKTPQWDAGIVQEPPPVAPAAAPAPLRTPDTETPPPSGPALKGPQFDRLARLKKLPVTVSVRLTERRITMSQLLSVTPGALLTFNKSCDDLLDLYVNNSLYGRGEAVKIGECFGLKVNEIGIKPVRASKVLDE